MCNFKPYQSGQFRIYHKKFKFFQISNVFNFCNLYVPLIGIGNISPNPTLVHRKRRVNWPIGQGQHFEVYKELSFLFLSK